MSTQATKRHPTTRETVPCEGCGQPFASGLYESSWCQPCTDKAREALKTWNEAALSFGKKENHESRTNG